MPNVLRDAPRHLIRGDAVGDAGRRADVERRDYLVFQDREGWWRVVRDFGFPEGTIPAHTIPIRPRRLAA